MLFLLHLEFTITVYVYFSTFRYLPYIYFDVHF